MRSLISATTLVCDAFSAGMGIGLMFFGVAEPVMHYLSPPVGTPETVAAAKEAMRLTFSTGDCTHGQFMPLWR